MYSPSTTNYTDLGLIDFVCFKDYLVFRCLRLRPKLVTFGQLTISFVRSIISAQHVERLSNTQGSWRFKER